VKVRAKENTFGVVHVIATHLLCIDHVLFEEE